MVCVGVLVGMTAGVARAESWGQYLVIIDDSASMDRSDADRLVVMASLALAGALEDGDQIMVVGLGELASGEITGPRFVTPGELLPGRDGGEVVKPVAGERVERLARHAGGTPCRDALARARAILEAVASAGAPQTLLLLTDGACNGAPVEPSGVFLDGLRSHHERRFRFVLLTREGGGRIDPALAAYAAATGWSASASVRFDARSLLRAFADALSFSRGLRYDDGGRVGLERTFAGAKAVRVLAIREGDTASIALARVQDGREVALAGGPTFAHAEHGWSLRVAKFEPNPEPVAVRSTTAGVDVLVIPSYGELAVEAVVAPCGDAPPLPWATEHAVRAGQPACAWARMVGDRGATIVPGASFAFDLELCGTDDCSSGSAMQPSADGTFNAQIGAQMPAGRHERWFRAQGGALARPVQTRRGFAAMAFGIQRLALASDPSRPVTQVDLGELPGVGTQTPSFVAQGAFPAGAQASLTCEVEGDAQLRECVRCEPLASQLDMQDPFTVQVRVHGRSFCPVVSASDRAIPVTVTLAIEPLGDAADAVPRHTLPMQAELHYAKLEGAQISVVAGTRATATLNVPSPVAADVEVSVEGDDGDDLEVRSLASHVRLSAESGGTASLMIEVAATDCCATGLHERTVVLRDPADASELRVPVTVEVRDPGFWTCPGKAIVFWGSIAFGIGFVGWVIRGFVSPASFADQAVLARADSHKELVALADGDEDWRLVRAYDRTGRGFYRPATVWLGGENAPLASLRGYSPDARITARPGGGADLVVDSAGSEMFSESGGWTEVEPGTVPIHSSLVLRRGDTYLLFRP